MAQRPAHHPPICGEVHRPDSENPGYIYGSLAVAGFGSRDFYIASISRALAVDMIKTNHYSRRIVNNSYVHLGVFIDGQLLGCLQFGYALMPRCVSKIVGNTEVDEYLELNRMWLSDLAPKNSESRAISYAIKYIKLACPKVKWIQSFADERCGKLGVVYQASNFIFVGSHMTSFYEIDGETYHEMLLTAHKKGGHRGAFLRGNIERAKKMELRQFRYIFFVKPKYRRDLRMLTKPYPKP